MTITATWSYLEPGTVVDRESHEVELATPDDVQDLIDTLARPHTSEAYLIHSARPERYNEMLNETQVNRSVVIGVRDNFGYMEYADSQVFCQLAGDPSTSDWQTTESGYFRPGTGVPLTKLVEAVTEFLSTAEQPACVQWREIS